MNKWIGMGRLTREPEVRVTTGNTPTTVAKFTLAVDRRIKKEGSQNADFIQCVAFGKTAEFAEKYLKRGTKVVAEGSWQTGSYTNQENKTVYTNECFVEHLEFAESKRDDNQNPAPTSVSDDFMSIPDGMVEDLPFN